MSDERHTEREEASRTSVKGRLSPGSDTPNRIAPASNAGPAVELDPSRLTPEEQMALFEADLKEHDWGHQPC